MGVDYYDVLKVGRDVREEDLRKAYKRLAMKWHPDKNPINHKEAEAKFKLLCEAYDVLSDPHRRQIYDLYGEEALSNPPPPAAHSPSSAASRSDSSSSFRRDADQVFADFFGDRLSRPRVFEERMPRSGSGAGRDNGGGKKPPPVESKLPCSLEELYKGARKKMRISRVVPDEFGCDSTEGLTVDEATDGGLSMQRGWQWRWRRRWYVHGF